MYMQDMHHLDKIQPPTTSPSFSSRIYFTLITVRLHILQESVLYFLHIIFISFIFRVCINAGNDKKKLKEIYFEKKLYM